MAANCAHLSHLFVFVLLFFLLLLFFSHRRHARLASLERHCGGKASLSCTAFDGWLKVWWRGTRCNCMISCFVSAFFVTCFCNRRRCKHQLQQYFPHRWQLKLKYLFVIVLFTSFHWLDASLGGWVRRNDKLCSTSVHHWWWVWQLVNKLKHDYRQHPEEKTTSPVYKLFDRRFFNQQDMNDK